MTSCTIFRWVAILLLNVALPLSSARATTACAFDRIHLHFEGTPAEQARCLLRPLRIKGQVGEEQPLPKILEDLVGTQVAFNASDLRTYLNKIGVQESSLGGSLDHPLSHAKAGDSEATTAVYLVIHDTSSPNLLTAEFPIDMNEITWKHNELSRYQEGSKSKAHLFVNRLGQSVTAVDLTRPWRATQFEMKYGNTDPKGLFVHVENIQPRRSLSSGSPGNDHIAPHPGLTAAQYQRLALLYIAASVRKGSWLIPAFHGILDLNFGDHDDPQNFDLLIWTTALRELLAQISPGDALED